MRTVAAIAAAALAGPGCAAHHHRVVVTGRQLHATLAARHDRGEATVLAYDFADGRGTATRVTVGRGATLGVEHGRLSLAELERGCATTPPPDLYIPTDDDCLLVRMRNTEFELRRYTARPFTLRVAPVLGPVALVATAGAAGCELGCRDGSTAKQASEVVLISAAVVLGGVIAWSIFSCLRGGCHD